MAARARHLLEQKQMSRYKSPIPYEKRHNLYGYAFLKFLLELNRQRWAEKFVVHLVCRNTDFI